MKLTPQHNLILNMLSDGQYHCPTAELFMKDDRKRISELNQGGYVILGDKTCDNPNHHHISKVKLRKLISRGGEVVTHWPHKPEIAGSNPAPATKLLRMTKKIKEWNQQFYPEVKEEVKNVLF